MYNTGAARSRQPLVSQPTSQLLAEPTDRSNNRLVCLIAYTFDADWVNERKCVRDNKLINS